MASFVDYLPERIRRPMFDEDEWPRDPLNMAIMLACFYVFAPAIFAGALLFAFTGWDVRVPNWLDPGLAVFSLVVGWIALDEWRSRRRATDGDEHGWIWQMVKRFGPRRRINQVMFVVLMLAIVAARSVNYVDRFTAADLDGSRPLFIAEALILLPVSIWVVVAATAWIWTLASVEASHFRIAWMNVVLCLAILSVLSVAASNTNTIEDWSSIGFALWAVLFFPGWAIDSLIGRIRNRPDPIDEADPKEVGRQSWW